MNSKYKKHLILSCLVTLLPLAIGAVLLRDDGERMFHLKSLAMVTVSMVLGQLLAAWLTIRDPGNRGRNQKPLMVVLWTIPLLSNICCGITYALARGYAFSPMAVMMVPMGLMFCAIGNYLPKVKMNATMGIKVRWTYTSEENWAATHRFGGKIWFLGGIALALAGLLPEGIAVTLMTVLFAVMIVLPLGYSWWYYRKQKARGDQLQDPNQFFKQNYRISGKASALMAAGILIFCGVMMFAGDIDFQVREDSLFIEADFYSDHILKLDDIESVELRMENVPGSRVGGFGSFRLLMGYFRNEEFGNYQRYTYYDPGCAIVLRLENGQAFVLSGKDLAQTQALFEQIQAKIG